MKRLLQLVMVLVLAAGAAHAEDIDVFSDCDNALPPNVLVIFDTSLSMRNQDVYDDAILDYSHEKTDWGPNMPYDRPYDMMYKEDENVAFWITFGWGKSWDKIDCAAAKAELRSKGYFKGELCNASMECKTICTDKVVVTRNYLNYMDYVEKQMAKISFGSGQATGEPGFDRNAYCPTTDYYNYHGDGLGYGDYSVAYGQYNRENDHTYTKMGMVRPFNIGNDIGGIKVKNIGCEKVRNDLLANGWATGKIWEIGNSDCVANWLQWLSFTKLLMTQNFMNYLDMKRSRRYNGIDALYSVIQNRHNDVNFGIMQFDLGHYFENQAVGNLTKLTIWKSDGGDLSVPCGGTISEIKRVLYGHYSDTTTQYGQPLNFGFAGVLFSDKSKDTPLAESLVEAGLYFGGQPSWFNDYSFPEQFFNTTRPLHAGSTANHSYKSPIECAQQGNHVIVITDGSPSDDFQAVDISNPHEEWITKKGFSTYSETGTPQSSVIGNYDDDSDDCWQGFFGCYATSLKQAWLDDVAAFLYDKDLSPLEGKQSVRTHAISFRMDADAHSANEKLLRDTAKNGHGMYAVTKNKKDLEDALSMILEGAVQVSTFSSAVTPVRQDDLTYSGDQTLLTTFHVSSGSRGEGNILKFNRDGQVIKGLKNSVPAPLINGVKVDENVRDLWSVNAKVDTYTETPDEGVAGVLYKRLSEITVADNSDWSAKLNQVANARKIYGVKTTGGSGNNPRYAVGDLRTLATGTTPEVTIPKADGANYSGDMLKQFLAEEVYGMNLDWPLGHIVHPDVVVAQYPVPGTTKDVYPMLFVGANDGMLHCFNMATGQEVWALVPPDQNARLHLLDNTIDHPWFIDGEMVLYHDIETKTTGGKTEKKRRPKTLIFGERRGGYAYHIVDVSRTAEPATNAPEYVAMVGGTDVWGQSWSTPRLCQVKVRAGEGDGSKKIGFLVGGGYDDVQQDKATPGTDTRGRFVGIYDLLGAEIKKISTYGSNSPIEACIVGARIIDHDHDAQRIFSRIYAADLSGNVYHFSDELGKDNDNKWVTKPYASMDNSWALRHLLFRAQYLNRANILVKQKIFYAPMYGTACNTNMVFAGTGDREKPADKSVVNSLYAVKERWAGVPLTQADLGFFDIGMPISSNGRVESYTERKLDHAGNPVTTPADFDTSHGWYFNFPRAGEKVISEISLLGSLLVFGTYTPPDAASTSLTGGASSRCNASGSCETGTGRIYIVNACAGTFDVKSIPTGARDPMPQPAIIFDKESGKVLISTGDGRVYDPQIPVVRSEYWKSSTSGH